MAPHRLPRPQFPLRLPRPARIPRLATERIITEVAGLEQVGPHLAITSREPGAVDRTLDALRAVSVVDDALLVLVASPDGGPMLRDALPQLARIAGERGAGRLVLAASGMAAKPASELALRPAQWVASGTGLTVLAPDGLVTLSDGGVLRVGGHPDAAWWICPVKEEPSRFGPQWPPPDEAAAREAASVPVPEGWTAESIADGIWLRPADPPPDPAEQPDVRHVLGPKLLLGRAGHPIPDAAWECVPPLARRLRTDARRPALLLPMAETAAYAAVGRVLCRIHGLEWLGFPATIEAGTAETVPDRPMGARPTDAPPTDAQAPAPAAPAVPVLPVPPVLPAPPRPSAPRLGNASSTLRPLGTLAPAARFVRFPVSRTAGCSAADRDLLRESLGPEYVRLAARADHVVTRLPALRSAPREEVRPELVAVLLHHTDAGKPADGRTLAAAARAGTADPVTAAYLACLAAGLRRLPSHHGMVLLGAYPAEGALQAFTAGMALHEPAAIRALSAHDVRLDAPAEFAIWSTMGRRTHLFDHVDEEPEVVFPPGTGFRVLEVAPSSDPADGPHRVLLREADPAAQARTDELDAVALRHLRGLLEQRTAIPAGGLRRVTRTRPVSPSPGLQ